MKSKCFVLASLCGLVAASISLSFINNKDSDSALAASHPSNYDSYKYSGTYYDSITATGEGLNGTLRKALTEHIFPADWYSYGGTGSNTLSSILQEADEDPTNKSNMVYFYTRDSVTKNAASSWNREHVWPKSLSGGNWGTGKAGTDILHIRPTYNTPNSTRGNLVYGDVSGGDKVTHNDIHYGYKGGGYFEPLPATKGDAARDVMYVWTAYVEHYSNLPEVTATFKDYDTIMQWHIDDEPDVLEGHRNDVSLTSKQKNRNPFVDHPEYAWKIFGNKCSKAVLEKAKEKYPDVQEDYLNLDIKSKTIDEGESFEIKASSSSDEPVEWDVDDSDVLELNGYVGKEIIVTGLKAGDAVVTATTIINDVEYKATCSVKVLPLPEPTPTPTPTPVPTPTPTPDPTIEPTPSVTPSPTEEPSPTYGPSEIPTPVEPTESPVPSETPEPVDPTPSPARKGCKGSIIASSIIVSSLSLLGIALLLIKKKIK